MTQEGKELLLKDLSARLCYGVKVSLEYEGENLAGTLYSVYPEEDRVIVDNLSKAIAPINVRCGGFMIEENVIRPYLRPMSSMTEEENKEFAKVMVKSQDCSYMNNESATTMVNDWYLSKGFDVRGLIPKGLALEALEDMYK